MKTTIAECTSPPHLGGIGLESLPAPVRSSLRSVAGEFRERGIELILFGSFAEGRAWPTSDLDLAYSGEVTPELERLLAQRIGELPTIRPVDLVPLASASKELSEEIRRHGIPLSDS